jgi:hypothetical protein
VSAHAGRNISVVRGIIDNDVVRAALRLRKAG